MTDMNMERLNIADANLTNMEEVNEAFDSAIAAARSAINSARATILNQEPTQ